MMTQGASGFQGVNYKWWDLEKQYPNSNIFYKIFSKNHDTNDYQIDIYENNILIFSEIVKSECIIDTYVSYITNTGLTWSSSKELLDHLKNTTEEYISNYLFQKVLETV